MNAPMPAKGAPSTSSLTEMPTPRHIEIMDTTLRDGEQTSGVSFLPHEKLQIARKLLRDVKVDRVEVASARVSEGEREAVTGICTWAAQKGLLKRVEVLGFIDRHMSIDWIYGCGGRVVNLLSKGSLRHCTLQLKKTPEEHLADIRREIDYAVSLGMDVNLYLEDWSNGMKDSPDYVAGLIDGLKDSGVKRFMLPDTLGVLNPFTAETYFKTMRSRWPELHFDFHAHNDYDLAVANAATAVRCGLQGLHTAVNGLGERAGNAPLSSLVAVIHDQLQLTTSIDESRLYETSRLVESYSGIVVPPGRPIVGENVFTQVAGVHADGDNKSALYCNALLPERFGRVREYALGKNSGKANILKNLEAYGLELSSDEARQVTQRIIELGDRKEVVTQDDLPYIVSDVLGYSTPQSRVKLLSYFATTAYGLMPTASLKVEIDGETYEAHATGGGQYDAFMHGLRDIYEHRLGRPFPSLTGYYVTIPPGGRTDALVQAVITWTLNGRTIRTRGLDADQTHAAIKATIKMLELLEDQPATMGQE